MASFFTAIYAFAFYLAAIILAAGLVYKIQQYARTPAPLKIPTTPAPTTRFGVVMRMAREVVLFESLFKSTKWTWLFGAMFHFALFLVLLRHLRYFIEPIWTWVVLIQPFGKYAAFAMIAGLGGLFARRIFVDRVRYISSPSDYLMLILLASIATTGMSMKFIWHTDIVNLKIFILDLLHFNIFNLNPLPMDFMLLLHLALVITLMVIFPFSKLLHVPGIFFSPTRNQIDNPREKRHLAPWAAKLENR